MVSKMENWETMEGKASKQAAACCALAGDTEGMGEG